MSDWVSVTEGMIIRVLGVIKGVRLCGHVACPGLDEKCVPNFSLINQK
jgi:hypothetical protein